MFEAFVAPFRRIKAGFAPARRKADFWAVRSKNVLIPRYAVISKEITVVTNGAMFASLLGGQMDLKYSVLCGWLARVQNVFPRAA